MITLPFTFEGQIYKPKFCVRPLLDAFSGIEEESGIQVHGLLGTDFLWRTNVSLISKNVVFIMNNNYV